MFTNKLREQFVRYTLAVGGKYLYLSTQDEDIAYRDERTRSVPSSYTSGYATSEKNGVNISGRKRTRCSSA